MTAWSPDAGGRGSPGSPVGPAGPARDPGVDPGAGAGVDPSAGAGVDPSAGAGTPRAVSRGRPARECDVVLQGGVTSGVVYPQALRRLGEDYAFRGLGGASAGAIGAAVGAAAELGRASGGFERLAAASRDLGDGGLRALFQPSGSTRSLLPLLLAATAPDLGGVARVGAVTFAAARTHPLALTLGALPGVVLAVVGAVGGGWTGWLLLVAGVVLAALGAVAGVTWRLWRVVTRDVPRNLFGICRGLTQPGASRPALTDWLTSTPARRSSPPTSTARPPATARPSCTCASTPQTPSSTTSFPTASSTTASRWTGPRSSRRSPSAPRGSGSLLPAP